HTRSDRDWSSDVCSSDLQRVRKERVLNVHIPGGVETGTRLRLANEGEFGQNGGPPGDLFVLINVTAHPIFTRKGNDIICSVPIRSEERRVGKECRYQSGR